MKKVKFYSAEVNYTGNFEDYDVTDFYDMARDIQNNGVDCFDYSDIMTDKNAVKYDDVFDITYINPKTKSCTVCWFEIEDIEPSDSEYDYEAECEWVNKWNDEKPDREA